jgi:hypothetical protein
LARRPDKVLPNLLDELYNGEKVADTNSETHIVPLFSL